MTLQESAYTGPWVFRPLTATDRWLRGCFFWHQLVGHRSLTWIGPRQVFCACGGSRPRKLLERVTIRA